MNELGGVPWPPLPMCRCGVPPLERVEPVVLLRDRLGAELRCPSCQREWATWFTTIQTAAIDEHYHRVREADRLAARQKAPRPPAGSQ